MATKPLQISAGVNAAEPFAISSGSVIFSTTTGNATPGDAERRF
ncbi:MAG: hypothetical protein ABSE48_13510 [Verrucomicrobiota bacterium]